MAETTALVGGNVTGDITQCKIETAQIKVDRKGAFSFTQKETYRSYDVCTKKVVNEYTNSTFTGGGLFMVIVIPIIIFIGLGMMLSIIDY